MDPASQAAAAAAGYPGVGLPANLLGGIAAPPGLLVDPATGIGLMLPAGLQQQLQQQHQNPGLGAAALDAAAAGGGGKAASAAAAAEGPSADVAMPPSAAADPADPEAVAAALAGRLAAAGAVGIFEKALTASDVSGGGRVVVPKVGSWGEGKGCRATHGEGQWPAAGVSKRHGRVGGPANRLGEGEGPPWASSSWRGLAVARGVENELGWREGTGKPLIVRCSLAP